MKYFSVLALSLLFTSTTTVYAHPGHLELEYMESRGYIDVPIGLLQIRTDIDNDQIERRQDLMEIVRLQTRDDGQGGQANKAGKILGQVANGLTAATAVANAVPVLGQIESAVLAVIKTAVEIFAKVLKAIGDAEHKDALKRGAFTQDVVAQTLRKHPGWNCIVVHTKHTKNFKGTEGKDWAHSHQELKVKFPVGSTIGFEIYTFREGDFVLQGDGGIENWAYDGNVIKGTAKEKKLTFGPSANAKGSASDATESKADLKKDTKKAGKEAKEQFKAEQGGDKGGKDKKSKKASPKKKK